MASVQPFPACKGGADKAAGMSISSASEENAEFGGQSLLSTQNSESGNSVQNSRPSL